MRRLLNLLANVGYRLWYLLANRRLPPKDDQGFG